MFIHVFLIVFLITIIGLLSAAYAEVPSEKDCEIAAISMSVLALLLAIAISLDYCKKRKNL